MKGRQGFASMDPEKRRQIARLGGKASGKKRAKPN
jgi:general stress protein YciG